MLMQSNHPPSLQGKVNSLFVRIRQSCLRKGRRFVIDEDFSLPIVWLWLLEVLMCPDLLDLTARLNRIPTQRLPYLNLTSFHRQTFSQKKCIPIFVLTKVLVSMFQVNGWKLRVEVCKQTSIDLRFSLHFHYSDRVFQSGRV